MKCLFGGHFLTGATEVVGGTCLIVSEAVIHLICLQETEPIIEKTLPAAIVVAQADDPRTLQT